MKENNLNDLATRPVGRLLWQYSVPAVVGMLVMALYNVVDRVFIGQVVGPEAIAGLALTFPLMNITTAVGVLVGVGSSTRISIMMGRGDKPRAGLILGNAATLTFANAAVYIAVFALYMDPILRAFGAGDLTLPYARTYMMWVLPGLLLTNVAFGLNNVLRATGYPGKAMYTMLIGAGVNIALDALFVLVLDWGMVGAAIATDIAMLVSAIFVVTHFFRPGVTLGFSRGTFGLRGRVILDIVSIGAAPAIVNAASCLINALINRSLLVHGGDMAIGAAGIFVTFTSLLTTVMIGINMGLQPILGYNYGAGLLHRLRRVMWIAMGAVTVVAAAGSALGLLMPGHIARAFTTDDYLIGVTEHCLRTTLWAFSIVGIPIVITCFFQSIGSPARSMFLSLTRQVIFLIPLMLWLPQTMGVTGVWLSFPISDLLALTVSVAMYVYQLRVIGRDQRRTTDRGSMPDQERDRPDLRKDPAEAVAAEEVAAP